MTHAAVIDFGAKMVKAAGHRQLIAIHKVYKDRFGDVPIGMLNDTDAAAALELLKTECKNRGVFV